MAAMATNIVEFEQQHENAKREFRVDFGSDSIFTVVTSSASDMESWILGVQYTHRRRLSNLIVGLDIEWRPTNRFYPYNPVATLQLCVGSRCIIFQLLHADFIPQTLKDFLSNPSYTFVGVGIGKDADKLMNDWDLEIERWVEIAPLAARVLGNPYLRSAGLKTLVLEELGLVVEKPAWVTTSRWDKYWLSFDQVQYACLDAFLSFELGRSLAAANE